ncbi:hypothetical protein PRIPAC_72061 [Pristionchus pacificus]|uniref:Uncharacterized protein n=1 Tax=Pristionchus pacificus TaxID=54126 RepID=A0A454XNW9_PRIPA|nr:hypothetical protein PRIPAC_72061 [Pristionchus pacificus]|eukprot:PDM64964.1 hypothetical protein PRIPAC_53220 [Pristionchus pacificus]
MVTKVEKSIRRAFLYQKRAAAAEEKERKMREKEEMKNEKKKELKMKEVKRIVEKIPKTLQEEDHTILEEERELEEPKFIDWRTIPNFRHHNARHYWEKYLREKEKEKEISYSSLLA